MKIILTLSHGQASVEHGFSINKSILDVNMKPESIVARKCIQDHMFAFSLKPHIIPVTNAMLIACKAARSKYQIRLEETEAAKKQDSVQKIRM